MHFVDPLRQPRRFAEQADALIRESLGTAADPFALIDAHLEASFAAVLAGLMPAGAPAGHGEAAPAGGPVFPAYGGPAREPGLTRQVPADGAPIGDLAPLVATTSQRHGVPAWLIQNVIRAESGGDPRATSPVGALGLMQLMPTTALGLGVTDPLDPAQNVEGGTRYLRQMLDRFGWDFEKAVAAYNAGPGAVEAHGGIPPYAETQAYVRRVLQR